MKRRVIIAVILLAGSVSVWAQTLPVIHWYERRPDLYYWGSNWVDSSAMAYPDLYDVVADMYFFEGDNYWGRACVTPQPMKVVGIAAPVNIYDSSCYGTAGYMGTVDTTSRFPEYFRLYQHEGDSIILKAEIRWDTATPQYKFEMVDGDPYFGSTFDLYEVYFDKPIIVHDTFYVGGTSHNTIMYGMDPDGYSSLGTVHYPTVYPYICYHPDKEHSLIPNPSYFLLKHLWPAMSYYFDSSNYQYGPVYLFDTTQFYKVTDATWLFPFFAIFDTNYVPGVGTYDDSCLPPTGLHLEAINSAGVLLAWNGYGGGGSQWQVAVAPVGVNINDGVLITTPSDYAANYVTVADLEYGHWYTARVRTLCVEETYGDWSDPIQFWYGDPNDSVSCPTPAGLQVVSTDVGKVVLQWAAGADAVSWETEVGPVGTEPGSGSVAPAPTYFTLRYGLDTATWHWARVRAKCGTGWYSNWSDTVLFYIPGDGNGSDTTTAINLVEQYTYLMPNPAREEVTVMSSFRIKSVELYGSDGKLLQTKEVNAIGTRLSLEGLPAGVYFVRVRTSAGVTTKRLVVTEK